MHIAPFSRISTGFSMILELAGQVAGVHVARRDIQDKLHRLRVENPGNRNSCARSTRRERVPLPQGPGSSPGWGLWMVTLQHEKDESVYRSSG
jgi:hypothetical protein